MIPALSSFLLIDTVAMFARLFLSDFSSSKYLCVCGLQRSGINSSDVEMLTLTNVTEKDAGEYICKVSNYIGEACQSGWLTVVPGKPSRPDPDVPFLPPGVVSWASSLTCCAALVPLVVSWWSWGSRTFSPLMFEGRHPAHLFSCLVFWVSCFLSLSTPPLLCDSSFLLSAPPFALIPLFLPFHLPPFPFLLSSPDHRC